MKIIISFFVFILISLVAFASTVSWELYTSNKKIHIHLVNTTWVSTIDGEEIIFGQSDGEGQFSNGISFNYFPPCEPVNGMTFCPDEPTYMNVFVNEKKINKLSLQYKNQTIFLLDKRGIYYKKKN